MVSHPLNSCLPTPGVGRIRPTYETKYIQGFCLRWAGGREFLLTEKQKHWYLAKLFHTSFSLKLVMKLFISHVCNVNWGPKEFINKFLWWNRTAVRQDWTQIVWLQLRVLFLLQHKMNSKVKSYLHGDSSHFLDDLVFRLNVQSDTQDLGSYRMRLDTPKLRLSRVGQLIHLFPNVGTVGSLDCGSC